MANYYRILQIHENASHEDIKAAYRKLAEKYHPDKNKTSPVDKEYMKQINKAYEVLRDPDQRLKHDRELGKFSATGYRGSDMNQGMRRKDAWYQTWYGRKRSGGSNTKNRNYWDHWGPSSAEEKERESKEYKGARDERRRKESANQSKSSAKKANTSKSRSTSNQKQLKVDPLIVDVVVLLKKGKNPHEQHEKLDYKFKTDFNISRYAKILYQLKDLGIIDHVDTRQDTRPGISFDERKLEGILAKHVDDFDKVEFRRKLRKKEDQQSKGRKSKQAFFKDLHLPDVGSNIIKRSLSNNKQKAAIIFVIAFCTAGYAILDLSGFPFEKVTKNEPSDFTTAEVTAESGLNLRKHHNTNADIVAKIPSGKTLSIVKANGPEQTLYGRTAKWFKVRYEDDKGWCWSGGLKRTDN
jgi:curved DNA-binding protein CbpA